MTNKIFLNDIMVDKIKIVFSASIILQRDINI